MAYEHIEKIKPPVSVSRHHKSSGILDTITQCSEGKN